MKCPFEGEHCGTVALVPNALVLSMSMIDPPLRAVQTMERHMPEMVGRWGERDAVMRVVRRNGRCLMFASHALRDDLDVVTAAVAHRGSALKFASDALRANRDVVMMAIRTGDEGAFLYVSAQIRLDCDTVRASVETYGAEVLMYECMRNTDRDTHLFCVQRYDNALALLARTYADDYEVALASVRWNGLDYVAHELKMNRQFILDAAAVNGRDVLEYHDRLDESFSPWEEGPDDEDLAVLQFMDEMRHDVDVVTAVLQQDGLALDAVVHDLRHDPTIVATALQQNGLSLELVPDTLRHDPTIVATALQQNGLALEFAPGALRNDPTTVLTALRQNGMALEFASDERHGEFDIVMAAVRQTGEAYAYVRVHINKPSYQFVANRDIIMEALKTDAAAPQFAHQYRTGFGDYTTPAIGFVPDHFLRDRDFVLEAVFHNRSTARYARVPGLDLSRAGPVQARILFSHAAPPFVLPNELIDCVARYLT